MIHNKNGEKSCSHCGTAVSQALSHFVTDQLCDVTSHGRAITGSVVPVSDLVMTLGD